LANFGLQTSGDKCYDATIKANQKKKATPMNPIHTSAIVVETGSSYPEPFRTRMGAASWQAMGDLFGLTQFGINLETLAPGAQSALRHWHTLADELVYVLEGELVLITNEGEFLMSPGMCIGFKAGVNNAHHLINRSHLTARFIVVGSRIPGDTGFYPDDDIAWFRTETTRLAVHKDGSPYK
jgi:uncharacterized cupin superfamily protein